MSAGPLEQASVASGIDSRSDGLTLEFRNRELLPRPDAPASAQFFKCPR